MGLLWFERAARRLDDDAGRRAVRVQLAVAIDDPAFGRCGAAAHVDDARFAAQLSHFLRDRTREVDLELERGEAAAGIAELMAHPSAVSRIVAAKPPCATPVPL